MVVLYGQFYLKRLSISVSDNLHKSLKVHAVHAGFSMNEVVVLAVKEYLLKCGDEKCKEGAT